MRLDIALIKKGLVDSREKAKYLIRRKYINVDGSTVTKPSKNIREDSKISIIKGFEFVGRGAYKLDGAVKHFKINFKDKVVADVGCSTGGFTDYALKHGAKRIYAIDIGDPLHITLRKDKRIIYMPNRDARIIKNLKEKIDLCLIDITFSPIEEILQVVKEWLKDNGEVLGLIKPPFELPGKPKKIYSYEECYKIAQKVSDWASRNGYIIKGLMASALKSKSFSQQEFFIYLNK